MAEPGDSTVVNSSKRISLADILDNEAEEIGLGKLVAMEDEHLEDDDNALLAKPEREGFCVECEGGLFLTHFTMPKALFAPISLCEEACLPPCH
jgi:hypothetical protein